MQLTRAILQTLVICQIWSLKYLKGETIENLINKAHFSGNPATGKFLTFTTIWSTQAWFIFYFIYLFFFFFVFGYENEENSNMFNVMSIEKRPRSLIYNSGSQPNLRSDKIWYLQHVIGDFFFLIFLFYFILCKG